MQRHYVLQVNGILAQRLVRTLCTHCRQAYPALPEVVEDMQLKRYTQADPVVLWRPIGCKDCGDTGYSGRVSIVELLVMSDSIRSMVMRHVTSGEVRQKAIVDGMQTMYENGLSKAVAGITTIEEVLRVTREE